VIAFVGVVGIETGLTGTILDDDEEEEGYDSFDLTAADNELSDIAILNCDSGFVEFACAGKRW